MSISTENDIIGAGYPAPAQLGTNADIIGGEGLLKPNESAPLAGPTGPAASTLTERIALATRTGALSACPFDYSDGEDWRTVLTLVDPFQQLYLDYRQFATITDEQIRANFQVLQDFWESKRKMLIRGGDRLKARFGDGTIEKASSQLEKASAALADAARRQAYFAQIEGRRLQQATTEMGVYMRPLLANSVMSPSAIKLALGAGEERGFFLTEAESYLLDSMRQAGFAPVKTVNQNPNLLLATWTPGGTPLTGRPHTKVLGQDVYSLAEAGQVLYDALTAGDERAARGLDTEEYLVNITQDLKENDALLDLRAIVHDRKLNQTQKRLTALYLLGPGLPYHSEELTEAFTSPAQLLTRTAASARDFTAAETAFKAGFLQIWLQAAATAEVKAAIPSKKTALDYRRFSHASAPQFPLWIGTQSFAGPEQLAAYIRQDENTWKMVSGSLEVGYLSPWLQALGKAGILEQQAQLATALLGQDLDANIGWVSGSENGRKLAVQALLQALDPQAATPDIQPDVAELPLTGLSGEEQVERTLTIANPTGGYQRVLLYLEPRLEGVSISATELFFDQRAPGQQLTVTVTGNAAAMPRNGRHPAQLTVRSAYRELAVPVTAEAVFPVKAFAVFVGGAALALAVVFGAVRYLLGLSLGEDSYQAMINKGTFLPMENASQAGNGNGLIFLLGLFGLGGLIYVFIRALANLAKPKYAA